MNSPLEWALNYASNGLYVLPTYPIVNGKCTCPDKIYKVGPDPKKWKCSPGKHPYGNLTRGANDATIDVGKISMWWGPMMWPDAGIAINLAMSHLLDIAPDGPTDLAEFIARGLPDTLTFRSGGGDGHQHFLYRLPDSVPQTRLCLPGRYDIMSAGYCVVPPTLHASGATYEWLDQRRPVAPPLWPCELLIDHIEGRTPAAEATVPGDAVVGENGEPPLDIDRDVWAGVNAKDRSAGLWAIAGELAEAGANEATIIEALRERDETLGWHKYTNRKDREERYAATARRQLANVMPRINLGGTDYAYANGATTSTKAPPPPVTPVIWPSPIGPIAYHGPLGAVVSGITPNTEADPAALFAHAIVIASAYIGQVPWISAGDMPHPARFDAAVVGETSKARKGTSAAPFRRVSAMGKFPVRIVSGLSSSEGLIEQVHDQIEKWDSKTQDTVIVKPGIADKRLVVLEGEMATLLRRMEREGNSVSATLRDAWDHGTLQTLVVSNPLRATSAHINLVMHITLEELRHYLHPTEISSGFANRILWFAAKRRAFLPFSGRTPDSLLVSFTDALDAARAWARDHHTVDWGDEAREAWADGYEALSRGAPGLYGQATQRAEAQVLRLSLLYAALDCSELIQLAHLQAALEVWRYCDDSARMIFGDRTGHPVADTILSALRAHGELTRTQISELFSRNQRADRIAEALAVLVTHGLARSLMRGAGARQSEVWAAR